MLADNPDPAEEPLPGGHGANCRQCPLGGVTWPNGCPSQERTIAAGRTLIEQGEAPPAVMLLKLGMVGLCSVGPGDVELGCTVRGPRTLLGFEAICGLKSSCRVWAVTDVIVCVAPIRRLGPWIGPMNTPIGALMRLGVEEANRRVTERLDVGGSSVARVARLLLGRCVDAEQKRLELSQRLLARVLSMTPETVSRALAKLQTAGAVASTHPIVVGDVERLRRFARS